MISNNDELVESLMIRASSLQDAWQEFLLSKRSATAKYKETQAEQSSAVPSRNLISARVKPVSRSLQVV